jgi:hypothetical protein
MGGRLPPFYMKLNRIEVSVTLVCSFANQLIEHSAMQRVEAKGAEGKKRRNIMHKSVYRSGIVAAFLGTVAVATAAEVKLTAQLKQTIMQSVQTDRGDAPL